MKIASLFIQDIKNKLPKLAFFIHCLYVLYCFTCLVLLYHATNTLFNIEINWIIFLIIVYILNLIPIFDVSLAILSLYGGYLAFGHTLIGSIVFITQCITLVPLILYQLLLYSLAIYVIIKGNK